MTTDTPTQSKRRKKPEYRFLVDAATKRQYAVGFVDGKPQGPISIHAEDTALQNLKPGEVVYAFDTESEFSQKEVEVPGSETKDPEKGPTKVIEYYASKKLWKLTADENGTISDYDYVDAEFKLGFMANPFPTQEPYYVTYTLTEDSAEHLKSLGFETGSISKFEQRFKTDDPNWIKNKDGSVRFTLGILSALTLPPHHPAGADVAMFGVIDGTDATPSAKAAFARKSQKPGVKYDVTDNAIEAFLLEYGVDLSKKAAEGTLAPVMGREKELEQARITLQRKGDASAAFTGKAGCGKTVMFDALAQALHDDPQTEDEVDARVVSINLPYFASQNMKPGAMEAALTEFAKGLIERGGYLNGRKIILAFDELPEQLDTRSLMGAKAGDLLKPFLTADGICVIASMTSDDWRKFSRDAAMARRFEQFPLSELSGDALKTSLSAHLPSYDAYHGMNTGISAEQLDFIIKMTDRFLHDQAQPNKSVKVIKSAYAAAVYRGSDRPEWRDIFAALARSTGLDEKFLINDDVELLMGLKDKIKAEVFGQDEAIDTFIDTLITAHSGLREDDKPKGGFLFQGPTGTGKTEVCKQVADALGLKLLRLDMSEFGEKHTVSSLIGSPPGYVGTDQGGKLTNLVRENPHCVVVLDEIEKAHPDIYDILLQIFDDGMLTDRTGMAVSFRNAIVVMTSNLGARDAQKVQNRKTFGFSDADSEAEKIAEARNAFNAAAEKEFRPEFLARLDERIIFKALNDDNVDRMIDKKIRSLGKRLAAPTGVGVVGVTLDVTEQARAEIKAAGYDLVYGARNLNRAVEKGVSNPLAAWLLLNKPAVKAFVAEHGAARLVIESTGKGMTPRLVKDTAAPGNDNTVATTPGKVAAPALR